MKYHDAANIFPLDEEKIGTLAKDIQATIAVIEGKFFEGAKMTKTEKMDWEEIEAKEKRRRLRQLLRGLDQLSDRERRQITIAANSGPHGGQSLAEPLYSKAVALELAFRSSGRLWPDVLKLFLR